MRKALSAVILVVLVAGCGGSKKAPQLTRQQYSAALNKLCTSANHQVAALKLTTAMRTWKQNGQRAAKIADQTVRGFKALTPPSDLAAEAEKYNNASAEIAAAVQDAASAAKKGDTKKFDAAISQQQNAGTEARTAASEIGASACAGG